MIIVLSFFFQQQTVQATTNKGAIPKTKWVKTHSHLHYFCSLIPNDWLASHNWLVSSQSHMRAPDIFGVSLWITQKRPTDEGDREHWSNTFSTVVYLSDVTTILSCFTETRTPWNNNKALLIVFVAWDLFSK